MIAQEKLRDENEEEGGRSIFPAPIGLFLNTKMCGGTFYVT
jgi:hypothetical protein